MKVFKFGGASIKDADAIRNAAQIVKTYAGHELLVVVSAMGKTTNALEKILNQYTNGQPHQPLIDSLKEYHLHILRALYNENYPIETEVNKLIRLIEENLSQRYPYDQLYDQIIPIGELISSVIVRSFFEKNGIKSMRIDARDYICTDDRYREGKVSWEATTHKIKTLRPLLKEHVLITQGFIGRNSSGFTTTLGREGSDFTAAIFASCLEASDVTIWKDVPGVMNADPKRMPAATVFDEISYQEAAEMTYYGASVIHPKTIKPLANKNIPLLVKNFDNPSLPGTKIHNCPHTNLPPLTVVKDDQCLISCQVTDFTFINEYQLSSIFHALSQLDIKLNVMQNSAISFSFCIDYRARKVNALIDTLKESFAVEYTTGLTLITVKNYTRVMYEQYVQREGVFLEQSSHSTLHILVAQNTPTEPNTFVKETLLGQNTYQSKKSEDSVNPSRA